jgi:hypothetical protein
MLRTLAPSFPSNLLSISLSGSSFYRQLLTCIAPVVMQVCDRHTASRVGLQRGFAAFIAPLHCGLAALLPGLSPIATRLAETRVMWDACDLDRGLHDETQATLASGVLG